MVRRTVVFYVLMFVFLIMLGGSSAALGVPDEIGLAQLGPGIAGLLMLVIFRKDGHRIAFFNRETPWQRYGYVVLIMLGGTAVTYGLSQLLRVEGTDTSYAAASLSLLPSEYFARQCFVSVEEPEPALDVMLDRYPDSVVFASDYPHGDCTFPGAPDELLESPMLTADQTAAVMWGNACRLYGVEPVFAEIPDAGVADEEALT